MKPTIDPYDMLIDLTTRVNLQEQYIQQLQVGQMQMASLLQHQAKLLKDLTMSLHHMTNQGSFHSDLE